MYILLKKLPYEFKQFIFTHFIIFFIYIFFYEH